MKTDSKEKKLAVRLFVIDYLNKSQILKVVLL